MTAHTGAAAVRSEAGTLPRPPRIEVVVEDTSPVADDVLALRLARADGGALPAWEPGAHIDLFLGNGLERQYSLCGDPRRNDSWTIAVLHEPRGRGGSHWVRTQVRKGTQLTVRGPRNNFPLVEASRYILIAGGIGITPLLPMAEELARRGADWQLHYGGREAASMAFTERLRPWPDRVRIRPETEYGLLDLDAILGEPHSATAVYCCGPEGLLEAAQTRCRRWPAGSLHIERFRPRPDARQGEDQDFEVVLDRSGVTLQVSVGESIVDVLESTGIEVDTSCREGTCGTCETTVLDGVPDHRDSFLTEEERNTSETMMICCSRARTARIVLDL